MSFLPAIVLCWLWAGPEQSLSELRRASVGGPYVQPGEAELKAAERFFAIILAPQRDLTRTSQLANELCLEVVTVLVAGEEILIVRERETDKRGRGFFAFRLKLASPVLVQAPHSSDDAHTGLLAERFLLETRASAAAWNTIRRDQPLEGGDGVADLAHLAESYFVALTRAFAAVHSNGIVLQVHGFAKSERRSDAGRVSAAIVSNGSTSPPAWLKQLASRLEALHAGKISVYPTDVDELGATTNSQMKALRSARHGGFVHLEMSLELRQRLKSSADERKAFWRCIPEKQP